MSTRIVAEEILALARLFNECVRAEGLPPDVAENLFISPGDVQQFIAAGSGAAGTTTIDFTVPGDHCAVVVSIEDFNADVSQTKTTSQTSDGKVVTEVIVSDTTLGDDVFYVFPKGKQRFTLIATAIAGNTYRARALGYLLPFRCYSRLARLSTKILS